MRNSEDETHKLLRDFEIQKVHLISNRRPDPLIIKKKKKKKKESAVEWTLLSRLNKE